jgi:hypothetical protein
VGNVGRKLWWEDFGFGPYELEQLTFGHGQGAVDADPLWTYVHSSKSRTAFNLSTGGLYGRVAMRATGLLTTVYRRHKSLDTGWIEISFTTCTRRFYLKPSFETRYTYYIYSSPEPLSWQ